MLRTDKSLSHSMPMALHHPKEPIHTFLDRSGVKLIFQDSNEVDRSRTVKIRGV